MLSRYGMYFLTSRFGLIFYLRLRKVSVRKDFTNVTSSLVGWNLHSHMHKKNVPLSRLYLDYCCCMQHRDIMDRVITGSNTPNSQISQCTSPTLHNAPLPYLTMHHSHIPQCLIFVTEMCTFLLQKGTSWGICLMHCGICEMARDTIPAPCQSVTLSGHYESPGDRVPVDETWCTVNSLI